MSPEPIRREPGPRDWTPGGGFSDSIDNGARARTNSTLKPGTAAPRGPRRQRVRVRGGASHDHGIAALTIGVIAVATAAISWPAGEGDYTVLLSTIGLITVALGVSTLRAARVGLARRRGSARTGILLGGAALASSAVVLANGCLGTSVPALPDLARAVASSVIEGSGASENQTGADAVGDAPGNDLPSAGQGAGAAATDVEAPVVGAPQVGAPAAAPPVFATADDEFMRVARELGGLIYLIWQVSPDSAPDALYVNPNGGGAIGADGSILAPDNEWVRTGYAVNPDGSYTVTMTGVQHGTIAYFHSTVGMIERR